MIRGLLRCGSCGSAMTPHTDHRRGDGNYQVYKCHGRASYGADYCTQGVVDRATVDEAILSELNRRYLDIDETRRRLQAKRESDATLAVEALAQAERELAKADDALARIKADYKAGKITAEDWADFREELGREREAALAASERARSRNVEIDEGEIEEETLRRLAELRAVVLGEIENAPDLDARRQGLRQLFKEIIYFDGQLFPRLRVPEAPDRIVERPLGFTRQAGDPRVALDPNAAISRRYSENDGLAV